MSENRLYELRQRWEAEPASRVFLQLADEYRRLGRLREAVEVLTTGLERSPNHLSAQVALGRCQLELGEFTESGRLLEAVIQRDPTQLVANKLLVESYWGRGDRLRAEAQLDRYRLLNSGDPEIEDLAAKLAELGTAAANSDSKFKEAVVTAPEEASLRPAAQAATDLPPVAPPKTTDSEPEPFGDLFDLSAPSRSGAARPVVAEEDLFDLSFGSTVAKPKADPPRLSPARAQEEDLFDLELPAPGGSGKLDFAPTPSAVAATRESPEPLGAGVDTVPDPEDETVPDGETVSEAERPPSRTHRFSAEEPATATLGHLYLQQGHSQQAKETFARLLAREPENPRALAGLREANASLGVHYTLAASELLQGAPEPLSLSERKAFILRRYLGRLRRRA